MMRSSLTIYALCFFFYSVTATSIAPSPSSTPKPVPIEVINDPQCESAGGTCLLEGDCSLPFTDEDKALCPNQDPRIGCCLGVNSVETLCKSQHGYCSLEGDPCPVENRITSSDCESCCKEI